MPLTHSAPATKSVDVTTNEERALDTYHLHAIYIIEDPVAPEKSSYTVRYSRGFMNGDDYVAVDHYEHMITGQNLYTNAITLVTAGRTRRDEVKISTWEMLVADVPGLAGVIT